MSVLNTVLGAVALCAALLFGMSLTLGPPERGAPAPAPGLTAAAVLAIDGMGPDGGVARSAGPASSPGRVATGGTEGALPAG